jgi:hypothetical protein
MKLKSLALSSVLATSLFGLQYHSTDYISMSTGGAGVASSYGSMSAFINPALVNNKDNKRTEFGLSIGIGIQEHELGDYLNQLDDADVGDTIDEIENGEGNDERVENNAITIQNAFRNIGTNNNYLLLSPTAALSFKVGRHWSLGVAAYIDAKAKAIINPNKLDYIYYDDEKDQYIKYDPTAEGEDYSTTTKEDYKAHSLDYAIENFETYLQVKGVAIAEIPLTYANNFATGEYNINWGISLKYMRGSTTYTKISFADDDYDPLENADKNTVDTTTFGVDLGFVLQKNDSGLKLGVAAKNVNTPKFDTIDSGEYELEPKITAGIAYSATDLIDITVDYDITEITDELTDTKYQYVGGGINFHPLTWFSLRVGAKKNLADEDDYNGMIYTAGVGFGLKWLQLDASVQVSENTGNYDGDEIPRYVKANIALVSKWGDN